MYKLNRIFSNEEGSGLVLALMVLVVLAALGSTLGMVTINSHRLADHTQDTNSAYYIAEAGANIAYEEFKQKVLVLSANKKQLASDFIKNIDQFATQNKFQYQGQDYFQDQVGKKQSANVVIDISKDINIDGNVYLKKYTIISTGEIDGKKRVVEKPVEVTWVNQKASIVIPSLPPGATLVTRNQLNFTGHSISGDVYITSDRPDSIKVDWGKLNVDNVFTNYPNSNNYKEVYDAPEYQLNGHLKDVIKVTKKMPINVNWNKYKDMLDFIKLPENHLTYRAESAPKFEHSGNIFNVSENLKLGIVNIKNGVLNIHTSEQINIVMDELHLSGVGKIVVTGKGRVNLHVKNNFTISGSSKINEDGNRSQLYLYYYGRPRFKVDGGTYLNGNLFVKTSDIELSGSGFITGGILTGGTTIDINGGSRNNTIIIAPNDSSVINFHGTSISGSILAGTLNMTSGTLEYQKFDPEILFPGTSSNGNSTEVFIEDVISTKPATEN